MRINVTSSVLGNQGENSVLWPSQHNGYITSSRAMERWEWQLLCSTRKCSKWHGHTYQSNKWKGVGQMKKQNDGVSEAEGGGCQSCCSEHWTLRRESSESGEKEKKMVSESKILNFPFIVSPLLLPPSAVSPLLSYIHTHMVTDTMIAGSSQYSWEQLPLRSMLTTIRNNTIALLLKFCQSARHLNEKFQQ